MDKFALTNVRVFDGERLLEPSTVVIDGDRIGTRPGGRRDGRRRRPGAAARPDRLPHPPHRRGDAVGARPQRRHHRARHGHLAAGAGRVAARPARRHRHPLERHRRHPPGQRARQADGAGAGPGGRSGRGEGLRRPAGGRGGRLHQDHRRSARLRRGHGPGPGRRRPRARPAHDRPRRQLRRGAAGAGGRGRRAHPRADRPAAVRRRGARDAGGRSGHRPDPDDDGGDRRASWPASRRSPTTPPAPPSGSGTGRGSRSWPGPTPTRRRPRPRLRRTAPASITSSGCWSTRGCPRSRRCGRRRCSRPSTSGWPTGGSSRPGKRADLVLIDGDPVQDISAVATSRRCGAPAARSPT